MAKVIEETNVGKIAKALIVNRRKLWVLVCGDYKVTTRGCILARVQALGIDPESQLYQDIDYSICTKEQINNRGIHWSHEILICDIDGLISEVINATCPKTYIKTIGLGV